MCWHPLWWLFNGTIFFWLWSIVAAVLAAIFEVPKCMGTLSVVPGVLLSCQGEIPMIGLLNLMSANVGIDLSPDPELNATIAMVDVYTQLVLPRRPLHVVVVGFPTSYIDGAACYAVHTTL